METKITAMKTVCFKGSIPVKANLQDVWPVLINQEFISRWEKGHDTFKELHLLPNTNTVIHWDIENDVDYKYNITCEQQHIRLTLQIDRACRMCKSKSPAFNPQDYISTVLPRIKEICEKKERSKAFTPRSTQLV